MSFTVSSSYNGYSIVPSASGPQAGPLDDRASVWQIIDSGGGLVTTYSDYSAAALALDAYNRAFYEQQMSQLVIGPPLPFASVVGDATSSSEAVRLTLISASLLTVQSAESIAVTDTPQLRVLARFQLTVADASVVTDSSPNVSMGFCSVGRSLYEPYNVSGGAGGFVVFETTAVSDSVKLSLSLHAVGRSLLEPYLLHTVGRSLLEPYRLV